MAIFIDTSGFVAVRNKDDDNHKNAINIMESILKNNYGLIYTSDYVFNEAVTVALFRTKNFEIAKDMGDFILKSDRNTLVRTTIEDFN